MRYGKIERKIWHDEKFVRLTPLQQRLFLYLLSCPHGNLIGLFVLREGYACEDLKCSPKSFRKDLAKVCEIMPVEFDKELSVLWIVNHLEYNPLTNPKQKKAALGILQELPKSHLLKNMQGLIEGLPEGLLEGLSEGLPKPGAVTVTDTGTGLKTISCPEIFEFWNSLEIIRHQQLSGDMRNAIQRALKNYTLGQIKQAIEVYAAVYKSEDTYWTYKWTLVNFLERGLKKFVDMTLDEGLMNYQKKEDEYI